MLDVLPSFSLSCYCIHFWDFLVGFCTGMAALTLRGMLWFPCQRCADNPTFDKSTRFLVPWDIGTSIRSTGTLEPWDIGTPSKKVHREEKGYRPENRQRAPTRGTGFLCSGTALAFTGGLSAARFIAEPLMEITTSWWCPLVAGTVFGLSLPETQRGGASPSLWVANFSNTVYWGS